MFYKILSLCCWLRHPISEVPHGLSRHYLAEPFHPNGVAHICIQRLTWDKDLFLHSYQSGLLVCLASLLGSFIVLQFNLVFDIRKESFLILPCRCNSVILSSCVCQFYLWECYSKGEWLHEIKWQEFALRLYFVFEEFPATEVIFQNGKRKKKEGKNRAAIYGRR